MHPVIPGPPYFASASHSACYAGAFDEPVVAFAVVAAAARTSFVVGVVVVGDVAGASTAFAYVCDAVEP